MSWFVPLLLSGYFSTPRYCLEYCSKISDFTGGTITRTICSHRYGYGSLLLCNTQARARAWSWSTQTKGKWRSDWKHCCFSKLVLRNQEHISRNFSLPPHFFFFLFRQHQCSLSCLQTQFFKRETEQYISSSHDSES